MRSHMRKKMAHIFRKTKRGRYDEYIYGGSLSLPRTFARVCVYSTVHNRHKRVRTCEVELGEEWRTTWPPTTNRLALVMVLQLSLVAAMALLPELPMGPAQRTQTAKMPAVRSALHEVRTALLSSVVAGVLSTASVAHARARLTAGLMTPAFCH